MTDFLIESLIRTGRFEDARRSVILYPEGPKRTESLGLVAWEMGVRGLVAEAMAWIEKEATGPLKSYLKRRVIEGASEAELRRKTGGLPGIK